MKMTLKQMIEEIQELNVIIGLYRKTHICNDFRKDIIISEDEFNGLIIYQEQLKEDYENRIRYYTDYENRI